MYILHDHEIVVSSWQNKQTRPRLLVLANFITCFPPWNTTLQLFNNIPSILGRVQRWRVSWIRCIPYWWYSPPRREDNTSYWISDGLGVTIDGKFAFYEHISGVCRKASSRAGVGRCATLLRTVPTIVTAHAKVVARGAKEMRNTQDTRTGFVSSNSGRF